MRTLRVCLHIPLAVLLASKISSENDLGSGSTLEATTHEVTTASAQPLEGRGCSSVWTDCNGCTSTGGFCGTPSGAQGEPGGHIAKVVCGLQSCAQPLEGRGCSSVWTDCNGCTSTGGFCGTPSGAQGEPGGHTAKVVCGLQGCPNQVTECELRFSDYYRNKDAHFRLAAQSESADSNFANRHMNDRIDWTQDFMRRRQEEGYTYIQRLNDNDRKQPQVTAIDLDSTMLWGYLFRSTADVTFHACTTSEHPYPGIEIPPYQQKPCDYMSGIPCTDQQASFQSTGETLEPGPMFDSKTLTCYTGTLGAGVHLLSAFRISSVFYKCAS